MSSPKKGSPAKGGGGTPSSYKSQVKPKETSSTEPLRPKKFKKLSDGTTNFNTVCEEILCFGIHHYGAIADIVRTLEYQQFALIPGQDALLPNPEEYPPEQRAVLQQIRLEEVKASNNATIAKKNKYYENAPKLHRLLVDLMDTDVKDAATKNAGWEAACNNVEDPLALLKIIMSTTQAVGSAKMDPEKRLRKAKKAFYTSQMKKTESLEDWRKRIVASSELAQACNKGVVVFEQEDLAEQFLDGLNGDFEKYAELKTELENNQAFGIGQEPKTLAEAFSLALDFKPKKKAPATGAGSELSAMKSEKDKSKKGNGKKKGDSEKTQGGGKSFTCFLCGEPDHKVYDCPKRKKDADEPSKSDVGAKSAKATILGLQEADDDEDDLRATLLSALGGGRHYSRMTVTDRRTKSSVKSRVLGLDSQCNAPIACNRDLVKDVRPCKGVSINTLAGPCSVKYVATYKYLDLPTYYNPDFDCNLIPEYLFTPDQPYASRHELSKEDGSHIVELRNGCRLTFSFVNGLASCHFDKDTDFRAVVPFAGLTTSSLASSYDLTQRQLKDAAAGQEFFRKCGGISRDVVIEAIENGRLTNVDAGAVQLKNARKLGRMPGDLEGKFKRRAAEVFGNRPEDELAPDEVAIYIDLFFFTGIAFFHLVSLPHNWKGTGVIKGKSKDEMVRMLRAACAQQTSANKKVKFVISDPESGVIAAETDINSMGAVLEIKAPGTKVGIVERSIQTEKGRFRAQLQSLGYPMPKKGRARGLVGQARIANIFASKAGFKGISAFESLFGIKPDARRFLRCAFGDTVAVSDYNATNDAQSRVITALAVAPTGNREGAWEFLVLDTNSIIIADQWTPVPLTDAIVQRCRYLVQSEGGYDIDDTLEDPTDQDHDTTEQEAAANGVEAEDLQAEQEVERVAEQKSPRRTVTFDMAPDTPTKERTVERGSGDINSPAQPHNLGMDLEAEPTASDEVAEPIESGGDESADQAGDGSADQAEPLAEDPGPTGPGPPTSSYDLRGRSLPEGFWKSAMKSKVRDVFKKHRKHLSAYHVSFNRAVDQYGGLGFETALKEAQQLHNFRSMKPIKIMSLTKTERRRIIRSHMFFKEKYFADGTFDKLKARLVAGGDQQDKNLFDDLSSPTVNLASLFIVAALAAMRGEKVISVDIAGAFLNAEMGDGDNPVHMRLSPQIAELFVKVDPDYYGPFVGEDGSLVVELKKALYGTVQAPKLWFDLLKSSLESIGYSQLGSDPCVFTKIFDGKRVTIALHVDDLLISSLSERALAELTSFLSSKFTNITINDGPFLNYLGMEFSFYVKGEVTITQSGYVKEVRDFYNISGTAANVSNDKLFKVDPEESLLDSKDQAYIRSGVAKLLYLGKRTYPELLTVTAFLTTRADKYTQSDMDKFHHAIRYLNAYPNGGITLRVNAEGIEINAYVDASHGVHADGKSHTGCAISIGSGCFYVRSGKQKVVAKSSTEAELIALSDSLSIIIWTKSFLEELGVPVAEAIIHQDNTSTIALAEKGHATSDTMKHIKVRTFLVKQHIDSGDVKIRHTNTRSMWADLLTKPLQGSPFWDHLSSITGQKRQK